MHILLTDSINNIFVNLCCLNNRRAGDFGSQTAEMFSSAYLDNVHIWTLGIICLICPWKCLHVLCPH